MDAGVPAFDSIASLIRNAYKIESVELEPGEVDRAILSLVPENVCRRHDVVPVASDERSIDLAMANPLDSFATQDVAYATGREVVPLFCPPGQLRELTTVQLSPDAIVHGGRHDDRAVQVRNRRPQIKKASGEAPRIG